MIGYGNCHTGTIRSCLKDVLQLPVLPVASGGEAFREGRSDFDSSNGAPAQRFDGRRCWRPGG